MLYAHSFIQWKDNNKKELFHSQVEKLLKRIRRILAKLRHVNAFFDLSMHLVFVIHNHCMFKRYEQMSSLFWTAIQWDKYTLRKKGREKNQTIKGNAHFNHEHQYT